jgi:hypothetical protein
MAAVQHCIGVRGSAWSADQRGTSNVPSPAQPERALRCQRHLPRHRHVAPADQPRIQNGVMGAQHGLVVTNAVRPPVSPATRWIRVVSMASARVIAGRMVVSRRTSIDLPAPGGDLVSPPARGMTSPWSQQGRLEIFPG